MAKYIKRTDVMKICRSYSSHCFMTNDSSGQDVADRIEDEVVELPTADVVEVRHGRWIDKGWGIYECSECGYQEDFTGRIDRKHKYCPNCGAKMDGRVRKMPKNKGIVIGLADRMEIVEDLYTGERTVKYNVVKEFSGNSKVRDMYQWFDTSPYKRLAVVAPEGAYKNPSSLRGTLSFELWRGTATYNYMGAYAKYGIVYVEKLG